MANFVVLANSGAGQGPLGLSGPNSPTAAGVLARFGQPASVYFLADYMVLVWNTNLLADMR